MPLLGPYDRPMSELPFQLTCQTKLATTTGRLLVETHPAVAIWLWCRSLSGNGNDFWTYKGAKANRSIESYWDQLLPIWHSLNIEAVSSVLEQIAPPKDDDELDALVGWVLGALYSIQHESVGVLGDESTGGILLPWDEEMFTKFNKFKSAQF